MEINTELNPTPHSARNHGIELLRIFAMLLAAVLHILKKGGVITASEGNLAAYSTVWLLEAAAYCAVNCYALIAAMSVIRTGRSLCVLPAALNFGFRLFFIR